MVWFSAHWASMPYISCQFPDGLIYQHVSDSVPSRVLIKLEKSRAILAQHAIAPKQDLTQQLVLMRLGSLETSQAEPRELGRLQRLVTFTTTSHMSFHRALFQPLPADPDNRTKRNTRLSPPRCSLLRCFPDVGLRWNSCRLMERPSNVVFVGHEVLTINFTETLAYFKTKLETVCSFIGSARAWSN